MKKTEIAKDTKKRNVFQNTGIDSIINMLPYKSCTPEGIVRTAEDKYQAYLGVNTTDLHSMNDSALREWMDTFTVISRMYTKPLKLISLTRRTKVPTQIKYWKEQAKMAEYQLSKGLNTERNRSIQTIALTTLTKLKNLERSGNELRFYFVVYSDTKKELKNNIRSLQMIGSHKFGLGLQNKKEVTSIAFRELNMNDESDGM